MMGTNEEALRQRIAGLEAEVADLRAERKLLRDVICAKAPPGTETTEAEYIAMMQNHVPGSGRKFLEGLGILPPVTK